MIRAATAADFEAIAALMLPRWHDTLRRAIDGKGCFAADEGGVKGYVALDHTFYANGFVSLLFVREEARRRGFGEALLRRAMAACRTPRVFTSTGASNLPMQRLLAKLGFERAGVIHDLEPGDPELIFSRSVP